MARKTLRVLLPRWKEKLARAEESSLTKAQLIDKEG